jgi:hypothetical protein
MTKFDIYISIAVRVICADAWSTSMLSNLQRSSLTSVAHLPLNMPGRMCRVLRERLRQVESAQLTTASSTHCHTAGGVSQSRGGRTPPTVGAGIFPFAGSHQSEAHKALLI